MPREITGHCDAGSDRNARAVDRTEVQADVQQNLPNRASEMIGPPVAGSASVTPPGGFRGGRPRRRRRLVPSAATLLGGIDASLASAWLEPAIAVATPEDLPDLAAAAVPAGPTAIAAVIERLGDADAEAAQAVVELLGGAPRLADAAVAAVERGLSSRACQRLAAMLEHRTDAPMAAALARLAMEPETIGAAAASSLRRWAVAGGDRRIDTADLERIAEAWRRSRRSDLLLVAAMAVGRDPVRLAEASPRSDDRGPVLSIALGSVLQRVGTPSQSIVADRIPGWLAVPALRRTAQRAMGERRPMADAARLFAACHRLELPEVRRGLTGVTRPARAVPPTERLGDLGSRATRGLVRYAARATLLPAVRERVLQDLALVDDAATAWRAAARLTLESPRRTGGPLVRIASEGSGPAVRVAARRLRELGGRESLDRVLARRSAGGVARAATRRLPEAPGHAEAGRSRAWRRAVRLRDLESDRESVLARWRAAMVGGDPERQLDAIREATRLGMVRPVRDAITRCLASMHGSVASAACSALRWADDPDSMQRLRETAATHEDPRVRANAIDAMRRRGGVDARVLAAAASSGVARERSSGALAVARLDRRRAGRLVGSMLLDARPGHRVSGIWTARRLRSTALVPVLVELVRRDPSDEVRRRARAAALALGGSPQRFAELRT
jgi:hypothetical protein